MNVIRNKGLIKKVGKKALEIGVKTAADMHKNKRSLKSALSSQVNNALLKSINSSRKRKQSVNNSGRNKRRKKTTSNTINRNTRIKNNIMGIGEKDCSLSTIDSLSSGNMVQRQIERGYFKTIFPVNPVKAANVIEFSISGDGQEFVDLAHTYLHISLKIIADDAELVGSTINYIGATIFNKIDILLNDTQISSSNGNSAY